MAKKTKSRSFHYRTDDPRYELIARRMFDTLPQKKQSIQKELDRELFQNGWEDELDLRRKQHRAMGIPDTKFYHPRKLKAMGRKYNYGRRRRITVPKSVDAPTPVAPLD